MDQNSLLGATHHTTPRAHSLGISTTFDICKLLINSKPRAHSLGISTTFDICKLLITVKKQFVSTMFRIHPVIIARI